MGRNRDREATGGQDVWGRVWGMGEPEAGKGRVMGPSTGLGNVVVMGVSWGMGGRLWQVVGTGLNIVLRVFIDGKVMMVSPPKR